MFKCPGKAVLGPHSTLSDLARTCSDCCIRVTNSSRTRTLLSNITSISSGFSFLFQEKRLFLTVPRYCQHSLRSFVQKVFLKTLSIHRMPIMFSRDPDQSAFFNLPTQVSDLKNHACFIALNLNCSAAFVAQYYSSLSI